MKKLACIIFFFSISLPGLCQFLGGRIGESQVVFLFERPDPIGGSGVLNATGYRWEYTDDWQGWYLCSGQGSNSTYFYPSEQGVETTIWYRRIAIVNGREEPSNNVRIEYTDSPIIPGTISGDCTLLYGEVAGYFGSIYDARTTLPGVGVTYQWEKSTDEFTWTNVTPNWTDECGGYTDDGSNNIFHHSTPIYTTTYFRRKAMAGNYTAYSNVITVTINPALKPGQIYGDQSIEAGGSGGMLYGDEAEGAGVMEYQWQQSTDMSTWINVEPNWTDECGGYTDPGTQSFFWQTSPLNVTTYFRRRVTMGSLLAYSNIVIITVIKHLTPGVIGGGRFINWNTAAGMLYEEEEAWTDQGAIFYQWQQSTDQSTWIDVLANWTDECGGYTDEGHNNIFQQSTPLRQTTYFRRKVTAGTYTEYSNVICVTVRAAPLIAGQIGNDQTISTNSTPDAFISLSDAIPADSSQVTVTYEWQISTNQTQWTALPTSNSSAYAYTSALTVKSYFRRKATYGAQTVYSNIITVTITYPPLSGGRIGMDMK